MYNLYPNVIHVLGYKRSVLLDLNKSNLHYVPKNIIEIVNSNKNNFTKEIEFLLSNELVYHKKYHHKGVNFETLNKEIYSSYHISTIYLKILHNKRNWCNDLYQKLLEINCRNIVIEIKSINKSLFTFFELIKNSTIENIELITDYKNKHFVKRILNSNSLISTILLFNSKNNKITYADNGKTIKIIEIENYQTLTIENINFIININFYIESLSKNVFYNSRIHIDENLNLYTYDYTRIINKIDSLEKDLPLELKLIQNISKDKINVCSDCEHRFCCYDSRIPSFQNNKLTYLSECNYNPYIAKWKGEEGYKTIAECGVIHNKNGFSIDHEKIASINNEIWGED